MSTIRESDLPGIGRKFQVETRTGEKLVIVVHDDGKRELYHFASQDPDDCVFLVTLDDEEARQVAGIIGGLTYQPKALETAELALDELVIEWHRVQPGSRSAGRTIGDLQVRQTSGATVIAVIEPDHTKSVNPGPDQVLRPGATVVVAGDRHQVRAVRQLLEFRS